MGNVRKVTSIATVLMLLLVFSTVAFASGSEVKFSGDVHVGLNETKKGDVIVFGGKVIVDGTVNGDVVAIGSDAVINGTVRGDVVVVGGTLTEGPEASVSGDKVEVGFENFSLSGLSPLNLNLGFNKARWAITTLIISVIISLLILVISPDSIERMADYLPQRPGRVFLVGFLVAIAFPILLILCMLTIILFIGILLTPLLIVGYILVAYIGNVAVSLFVGKRLSMLINQEKLPVAVKMLMGLVVLWGARNVPFIGFWISSAMIFITLGVVIASRFGRAKKAPANPDGAI